MTLVETVRMLNRPKESALCVEYGNVKSELSAESLAWIKDKVLEEIYIGVDADEDKLAIVLKASHYRPAFLSVSRISRSCCHWLSSSAQNAAMVCLANSFSPSMTRETSSVQPGASGCISPVPNSSHSREMWNSEQISLMVWEDGLLSPDSSLDIPEEPMPMRFPNSI